MKADEPAAYAQYTSSEYADFETKLHTYMLQTESIEQKAHLMRDRLDEYVAMIENTVEALLAQKQSPFETEQLRLSQRIREATDALSDLRSQVMRFTQQEQHAAKACQRVIDGKEEPEFSSWLHALLTSGEAPQTAEVSADQIRLSGGNTRQSRLGSGGSVLSKANSGDMMIVTHEMRFARDVSTRVLYLDEGGIYEDGTPEQIFDHPIREKTRQFIRRLRLLPFDIPSYSAFEFLGALTEIEHFGKNICSLPSSFEISSCFLKRCSHKTSFHT